MTRRDAVTRDAKVVSLQVRIVSDDCYSNVILPNPSVRQPHTYDNPAVVQSSTADQLPFLSKGDCSKVGCGVHADYARKLIRLPSHPPHRGDNRQWVAAGMGKRHSAQTRSKLHRPAL